MIIKIINTISGKLEKQIRCKNKNEATRWARELNNMKSPFFIAVVG